MITGLQRPHFLTCSVLTGGAMGLAELPFSIPVEIEGAVELKI